MGKCYFCEEKDRVSYFSYYCGSCAMLRRWLLTYSPDKCCSILKRTLTRDDKQIDFKITQEIKKLVLNELPTIKEQAEQSNGNESDDLYEKKLRPRKK